MTYPDVFIVGAARTPIGKFLGALSPLKASDLGAIAIREAMKRAAVQGDQVDEVLMGHVVQGGQGQAPARQAQIKAGVDPRVGAVTINKVCGSGLKAVMMGAQAIKAGDAHCVVAGGQESMSTAPHYLFTGRTGQKLGDTALKDGVVLDGLWCSFNDCHMIELAQYTAEKAGLAREVAYSTGGGEPKDLFFAPIDAVRKLLAKMNVTIDHFDLIEANEAFAAQALADGKALGWDWSRVNVNGGAVALGHPIGASGARVLTTLLYALKQYGKRTGLATLCLGGGNAVALSVEMI